MHDLRAPARPRRRRPGRCTGGRGTRRAPARRPPKRADRRRWRRRRRRACRARARSARASGSRATSSSSVMRVVAVHDRLGAELAQVLHEVVDERVVVVDHEHAGGHGADGSRGRSDPHVVPSRDRALGAATRRRLLHSGPWPRSRQGTQGGTAAAAGVTPKGGIAGQAGSGVATVSGADDRSPSAPRRYTPPIPAERQGRARPGCRSLHVRPARPRHASSSSTTPACCRATPSNWYLLPAASCCISAASRRHELPLSRSTASPATVAVHELPRDGGELHRCDSPQGCPQPVENSVRDHSTGVDEVHVLLAVARRLGHLVVGHRSSAPRRRRSAAVGQLHLAQLAGRRRLGHGAGQRPQHHEPDARR